MTIYYASAFDSAAAGSLPAGWASAAGAWQVGTVAPTGGHGHSFGSTTHGDGDVAILAGVAAVADMQLSFTQAIPGLAASAAPMLGALLRMDAAYQNGYAVLVDQTGTLGALRFLVFRRSGGGYALVAASGPIAGITFAASDTVTLRAQIVGSAISLKLWPARIAEPAAWQYSVSDGAITAPGYAGLYYALDGAGGASMAVCDVVLSDPPGLAVTPPSGAVAGAAMTVAGTYSGQDPSGLNLAFDGAAFAAVASPSIAGGGFSFSVTAPAAGLHALVVQEANDATVTAGTSFTVGGAPSFVAIAPNDPAILYSPFGWNVTGAAATAANGGAALRVLFSGAACTLGFDASAMASPASQVWWRIDTGAWSQAAVAASLACAIPAATAGNADVPFHLLEVVVKSITETQNRWNAGASGRVVFTGLTLGVGATARAPLAAPRRLLVFGDSLVEGVRTLGEAAALDTDRNDATLGWAYRLGALLGAEVGVIGFGGQGLLAGGSGNVPALPASYASLYAGVSRGFAPAPDLVVLAIGTNDLLADTVAAASGLLNGLLAACPGVPIAVLRPFGGAQAGNLAAAIAACSAPAACHWIDTTGLLDPSLGVDSLGLHPSGPNNLAAIAPALAGLLRPLLGGAATPPGFRPGFRQSLLA